MRAWLNRLTASARRVRRAESIATEALQRVHRLEIALDLVKDDTAHLKARQEKLGTRLGGALGGRPPRGAPAAQLDLASIPRGDKAGLRAFYRLNPPPKETT